jgi:hypothetical protein
MFIAKLFMRLPIALAARPRNCQMRLILPQEAEKPALTLPGGSAYGAAKEQISWPIW